MRYCQIFIILCCFTTLSFATDLTKEAEQKASSVFFGVDDTMLRINTGVCRIYGETIRPGPNEIKDNILMAFDYQNRFFRFDNGDKGRSLFTPDTYYQVWNIDTSMSVEKSTIDKPNISYNLDYVEIQSLSLFVPIGPPCKPYTYLESILHKKDFKYIEYQELSNGLVHIKVALMNLGKILPDTQTYTVDIKNGYTLRQLEHSFGYISDISWKNINNTWVPISYVMNIKKDSQAEKQGMKVSVNWKIEWEQVNEKVNPKLFDLKEMVADLQKEKELDVPIYSNELGQLLQIGEIGNDTGVIIDGQKGKRPYFNILLVTLGTLMIIGSLCKMHYNRKRRIKQ